MNYSKLGFMTLIFLIGATILVPVFSVDIASASCGACAAAGDHDRYGGCAVRDYDRHDSGDCGSCERCSTTSHFSCGVYRCSWVPDLDSCMRCYGCAACAPN
jgi:hypothetical protein